MKIAAIPKMRCYRCFYEWAPVRSPVRMCPRCKSRLFDVPKIAQRSPGHGLGIDDVISPYREQILRVARKHGAKTVWVFGSIARNEGDEKSDVDILVEWKKRRRPLARLDLAIDLRRVLGRKVDVASEATLPWTLLPSVLAERTEL